MKPRLTVQSLREVRGFELLHRFVFGGLVSVGVALIADHFGAVAGGVFLAFPAILPASLTLVKEHDGRKKAADEARGASLGAVGLLLFAGIVAATAERWPPWAVMPLATLGWGVSACSLFAMRYGKVREDDS